MNVASLGSKFAIEHAHMPPPYTRARRFTIANSASLLLTAIVSQAIAAPAGGWVVVVDKPACVRAEWPARYQAASARRGQITVVAYLESCNPGGPPVTDDAWVSYSLQRLQPSAASVSAPLRLECVASGAVPDSRVARPDASISTGCSATAASKALRTHPSVPSMISGKHRRRAAGPRGGLIPNSSSSSLQI